MRLFADLFLHKPEGKYSGQFPESLGTVFFLAAKLLRFEHNDAIGRNTMIVERQESLLDFGWQRIRGIDIKTKLYSSGNLVDMLAAGPSGPNCRELNLGIGNCDFIV